LLIAFAGNILTAFSQLFLAMLSTAFPTSLSLCLKVVELRLGTFIVDYMLIVWVCPIPAWRQPKAILVY
jgi:Na+-transporting NADH:ubiquinone oxidoreductase subunit NqrD